MKYPKIYLTLDNCFAIKRWTAPSQWMPLVKEIGFSSVQASFDNEIDFLYSPDWYMEKWFAQIEEQEEKTGVSVDTFYTGYQTYRTAGLGHFDGQMADYLTEEWMIKAVKRLGKRHSHMGVSFFALTEDVLQNPELYEQKYGEAVRRFKEIGRCAVKNGIYFCSEAMYAPHQPSWTIKGTKKFLADCHEEGCSVYTTIDAGHMTGQHRFRKPSREQIKESIEGAKADAQYPPIWIGAEHTINIWRKAAADKAHMETYLEEILEDIERYSYLFSDSEEDSSPYAWLQELACYSPIIHMQQTNGITASHAAFTQQNNEKGMIEGRKVLKAIEDAYEQPEDPSMPPRAKEIYLAFEIFGSNTEYSYEIINKLKETAAYWKQFVPENGIELDKLLKRLE